jgi:hypothetical protein
LAWGTYCHRISRHILGDNRIRADDTVFADRDLSDDLRSRPDQDAGADFRRIPRTSPVADGNTVVYGAVLAKFCRWMEYDAAEMVDAEPSTNPTTGRNRYSCRDLDETFADKPEGLSRDPLPMEPVEKTIYQNCLEPLRQDTGDERPEGSTSVRTETPQIRFDIIEYKTNPLSVIGPV